MKYKFTGVVVRNHINASVRPDGTFNFIDLGGVLTTNELRVFKRLYNDKTITVELTFKGGVADINRGRIWNYIGNIKSLKVIDND